MKKRKNVFWVDLNRFDTKTDKSTWLEMSASMAKHGYDITILTGYESSKYYPKNNNVNIKYFETVNVAGLFRYSLLFNILRWLIWHSKRSDIFILTPGGLYVAPILRLFKKSNIHLDVRTVPVDIHSTRDKLNSLLFWKFTLRFLRHCAKGFSFITERLRESVEKEFNARFDNYVIWHSGVNIDIFRPLGNLPKNNDIGEFKIFYHGTMTENRGVVTLVEAINALQGEYKDNVTLTLVGKGPAYEQVEKSVELNGLERFIELKGFIPYEDIPEEIAKADCCICPLPNYPEWEISSPIKIFEYMACGKPVILTPISAHLDVVKTDDFVIWAEGFSSADLRRAIERAYDERDDLIRAGKIAIDCVKESYTWETQGRRLAQYIDNNFVQTNIL